MKKLTLIVILLAIVAFSTALYFLIAHFSSPPTSISQNPIVSHSPTQTPNQTATVTPTLQTIRLCREDQLTSHIYPQGAAGNIYAKIEIINSSKTNCDILLGNTIMAQFEGKNIQVHYQYNASTQNFKLSPSARVYSQIHYPNGPQCQNGVSPKQISFLYFVPQTDFSMPLKPPSQLNVQACTNEEEKTTIDIWPLSKNPITQ